MDQTTTDLDAPLRARLTWLFEEGQELWHRFDAEVRIENWHPFVPADYEKVLAALLPLRGPGRRFLEWGSAMGVITIMADLLGFEAYGIEIDPDLVAVARDLAARAGSQARFTVGSFLPAGYEWRSSTGDRRLGTLGQGESGYPRLGHPLEDFDLVFAYPWDGEAAIMHDVMRRYGSREARFLLYGKEGVHIYRAGRETG